LDSHFARSPAWQPPSAYLSVASPVLAVMPGR